MATRALVHEGALLPSPCRVCRSPNVEAHHLHYDQEDSHLVVDWLCKEHHALEHGSAAWTKQLGLFVSSSSSYAHGRST